MHPTVGIQASEKTQRARANTRRRTTVVAAAVVAVAGSFIGSGALGGTPIAQAAGGALGPDATLISLAVPAFGVWSLIYLCLCAYALWHAVPGHAVSTRQRRLGYPIAA